MTSETILRTKLVYVLTSNGRDEVSAMLIMSLYSLRLYYKEDIVVIVMDRDTFNSLNDAHSVILEMAKAKVVDIPEEYNTMQRSRYLKTNLRRIIKGDFLYVDSDTVICGPLQGLDNLPYDLGMIADQNNSVPQRDPGQLELNMQAGFDATGQPYYNGGVILVRDTTISHRFFELWFELWLQSVKRGVSKDQPALCEANKRLGHPIQELDGIWNFQLLNHYLHYLPQARIVHYWNIYEWKKIYVARTGKKQHVDVFTALWLHFPRISAFLLYLKRLIRRP